MGVGHDSGSETSITKSGISGIAGDTQVRTGDEQTGLKSIFNAQQVQNNVNAEVLVTQTFSPIVSKAVENYADAQLRKAMASGDQEGIDNWKEGGAYRVLAHAIVGGLITGRIDGALGAGTAAFAAPIINDITNNLPDGVRQAVGTTMAAALGATTGGTAGAASAINEDANNRVLVPKQLSIIGQMSGGDAQKAQDLTAVLCYQQDCTVGDDGKINDPTAQALYNRGKQLSLTDTNYYMQLLQEVKGAGLISGAGTITWRELWGMLLQTRTPETIAKGTGIGIANFVPGAINGLIDTGYAIATPGATPGFQLPTILYNNDVEAGVGQDAQNLLGTVLIIADGKWGAGGAAQAGSALPSIYTSQTPIETQFPELSGINPGYPNVLGTTTNCVSCVNAYMQRMAGELNAIAMPGKAQYPRNIEVWGFSKELTTNQAISQIQAKSNGAYGALVIEQSGVDHVIGYLNNNGVATFVDTQSGNIVKLSPGLTVKIGDSIKQP